MTCMIYKIYFVFNLGIDFLPLVNNHILIVVIILICIYLINVQTPKYESNKLTNSIQFHFHFNILSNFKEVKFQF
jgi:hypothetical protein